MLFSSLSPPLVCRSELHYLKEASYSCMEHEEIQLQHEEMQIQISIPLR